MRSPASDRVAAATGILVFFTLLLAPSAWAAGAVHWTYSGEHGPEHWAELSPDFVLCGAGVNQSPIDIIDSIDAPLPPLELKYGGSTTEVVNNGHTFQVNVEPGSFMHVGGLRFELAQFHFHSPSEHWVAGQKFPLEAHFVHLNAKGELAVVGVLFRTGDAHPSIGRIMQTAPPSAGMSAPLQIPLKDLQVKAVHEDYYRYNGSLTTPPCSEGVRWFVLQRPAVVSQGQLDTFLKLIGEDARGPQPVNARPVLR